MRPLYAPHPFLSDPGFGAFQGTRGGGLQGGAGGLGGAFDSRPPAKVTAYRGVEDSIRLMKKHLLSARGGQAPEVRFVAESIVRDLSAKDYLSEILAIRYWVNEHIPYLRDPTHVEWMRDPVALLADIKKYGKVRADCDEYGQLCAALWLGVGNRVQITPVGFAPKPAQESHVFVRCLIPKTKDAWIVCDPVAGTREAEMLTRVKQFRIISLD